MSQLLREEAPALPPLGPVLEFLRRVWAVDHGLQGHSKRMAMRLGVTGPQRWVLRVVGRFPGVTAGQLARALQVHPSTLSGILRRLETRQLVVRRRDPRDGRRASFGLTEKGRALERRTDGTVEGIVGQVLEKCPPAQVEAASHVLAALAEALAAPAR